jgi:hypothetical protein
MRASHPARYTSTTALQSSTGYSRVWTERYYVSSWQVSSIPRMDQHGRHQRWCKIAAAHGTNDTFLPNSAIGKVRPGSRDRMDNENSQILREPHLNVPSRRIWFAVPRPRDQISEIFMSNREGYSVDAQVKLLPHPTPGPDNQRWLWPLLCESLVEADSSMRYTGRSWPPRPDTTIAVMYY